MRISHIDIGLIQLTFAWSRVLPDCSAIHYNIKASNCGSCPTTTNHVHTNVTCNDVPTNGSVCTFAVQTVLCGNVIGNKSNSVSILVLNSQTSNSVTESSSSDNILLHTASIGFLAGSLVVCIVVITTAIIIAFIRIRANFQLSERGNTDTYYTDVIEIHRCRERGNTWSNMQRVDTVYDEVYSIPSNSFNNFKHNIAYGQ